MNRYLLIMNQEEENNKKKTLIMNQEEEILSGGIRWDGSKSEYNFVFFLNRSFFMDGEWKSWKTIYLYTFGRECVTIILILISILNETRRCI